MHNGAISRFLRVKRKLLQNISNRFYYEIAGTTDSEHVFALFLHILGEDEFNNPEISPEIVKNALVKTIHVIIKLVTLVETPDEEHMFSSLNFAVTNGNIVVASRYRDGPEDPPSLYYQTFERYELIDGHAATHPLTDESNKPGAVIIASEPVTQEPDAWHLLNKNTILLCNSDNTVTLEEITELEVDKHYSEWHTSGKGN